MVPFIILAYFSTSCYSWDFKVLENIHHGNESSIGQFIFGICQIILETSPYHKEVYIIRKDKRIRYDHEIADLHKHTALVIKTFSQVDLSRNRSPATCEEKPVAKKYSLVVVYSASSIVILNLLYDRATYPGTIFILLITDEENLVAAKRIIHKAWNKRYIFRVLLLVDIKGLETKTIIFEPHAKCGQGEFRDASSRGHEAIGAFLVRTLTSLEGCPLNITMYEREETAVRLNDTTFTGQDGRLIELLREKMNFTPVIHMMEGKMVYGYKAVNGSNVGQYVNYLEFSTYLINY